MQAHKNKYAAAPFDNAVLFSLCMFGVFAVLALFVSLFCLLVFVLVLFGVPSCCDGRWYGSGDGFGTVRGMVRGR